MRRNGLVGGMAYNNAINCFFKRNGDDWSVGSFVGHLFHLDYSEARLLVCDYWKERALGLPQGCFLLAYYDCHPDKRNLFEALLLRVREPVSLPQQQNIVSAMIEYYKEDIHFGDAPKSKLDELTRYDFSFSGLSCTILGCFYLDKSELKFGADVANFYSPNNYSVYKPSSEVLKLIVNSEDGVIQNLNRRFKIGYIRYSSSKRFDEENVPVHINSSDFAGKRTGLFGMTRTGKSNTIKKIIQINEEISSNAIKKLDGDFESPEEMLKQFDEEGNPKYPIGQIIFDMNGEYANANLQDEGTAIFEMYSDKTSRYSTVEKKGFKTLKTNFYDDIMNGFEMIRSSPEMAVRDQQFVDAFLAVNLDEPENDDKGRIIRHQRHLAVYKCILYKSKFSILKDYKIKFSVNEDIRKLVDPNVDPSQGLTLQEACDWWEILWNIYEKDEQGVFKKYKDKNKKEWADDDLKSLLVMLTMKRKSGGRPDCGGYRVLIPLSKLHTTAIQKPYEDMILSDLRNGKIVIIDLSMGDASIQSLYSERISKHIFHDSMRRFTSNKPNNFIQFYFEEAHNLFPKHDNKDLSQVYIKIAKEGAKLNLGLIYATQEVSSISPNILKNTQNWFISHLNNSDEIKELSKYYDFSDFGSSLIKFSQDTDKGFARVKTYSNPFVIPMQIDRFEADTKNGIQ